MPISISAGPRPPAIDPQAGKPRAVAQVPAGLRLTGTARYTCDVLIDGTVQGRVETSPGHAAVIGSNGRLDGTLLAGNALVNGQVIGDIECAAGMVRFAATAVCDVSVLYGGLDIAKGSNIQARLRQATGHA